MRSAVIVVVRLTVKLNELNFTPSEKVEDGETLLFGKGSCDQSVQVVALAEHPQVVGQPEVARQNEQRPATEGVLFVNNIVICIN